MSDILFGIGSMMHASTFGAIGSEMGANVNTIAATVWRPLVFYYPQRPSLRWPRHLRVGVILFAATCL